MEHLGSHSDGTSAQSGPTAQLSAIRDAFVRFAVADIVGVVRDFRRAYALDPRAFERVLFDETIHRDITVLDYWRDVAGAETTADSMFNLGLLYSHLDEDENAVKCFEHSADLGLPMGDLAAGDLLVWLGRYSEGEPHLLRARDSVADEPERANATALLGVLYFERDARIDDEVVGFLSTPAANSERFDYTLGRVLEARGEHQQAKRVFERALLHGDQQSALDLGNLLWEQGDIGGAESAFRTGIELGNKLCVYNLGSLLIEVGRSEEGEGFVSDAAAAGDSQALARLAQLRS